LQKNISLTVIPMTSTIIIILEKDEKVLDMGN